MENNFIPTKYQQDLLDGLICPYCKQKSEFINSSEIYGVDYGMMFICKPCDAYVGTHKENNLSLGRLANKELRQLKKEAHKYFDLIWKQKHLTRTEAYNWLGTQLCTSREYTHIGYFNNETCLKVIEVSKMILNDIRRLDLDFGTIPLNEYFE